MCGFVSQDIKGTSDWGHSVTFAPFQLLTTEQTFLRSCYSLANSHKSFSAMKTNQKKWREEISLGCSKDEAVFCEEHSEFLGLPRGSLDKLHRAQRQ